MTTLKTLSVTRVKTFAVAALAAAAIGIGGFANVPAASAAVRSCGEALKLHDVYMAHGNVFYAVGNYSTASYWYGKAAGVVSAAC